MTPDLLDLLNRLEDSGLTGRGGAGFGTAVKVRAAVSAGASLIVNGCDGEYGAVKDAFVVEHHLDELIHGANLLGRNRIRYAAHRGSRTEQLLRSAGLHVLSVSHRYVSSEESALVSLANGGLARPMTKRIPVVFGSTTPEGRALPPTVVLNAETVWRVAQIADRGPAWFRSFGTVDEPGPRLASVSGAVRAPGVLEAAAGVRVGDLIAAAGGADRRLGGVGRGGLSGGWLSPREAERAVWSRAGLAAYELTPGPGTVLVLGDDECPLRHVSAVLEVAAGESAGQCGPCMFGVPAAAEDVALLAAGRLDHAGWRRLRERLGLMPRRGACRFPDGVAGYARSALRAFAGEVDAHRAGACSVPARPRRVHAVAV
jgi:NADH:ubiquinone oxidoreductase subunit F (NADH-binding)